MNYHSFKFNLPELMPNSDISDLLRQKSWRSSSRCLEEEMSWAGLYNPFNFLPLDYLENKREWGYTTYHLPTLVNSSQPFFILANCHFFYWILLWFISDK
jgi:hypothetical protein